jgi:hypothetical protein
MEVRESFLLTGDEFNITPLLQWSLPENNEKSLGTVDSRTSIFKDAQTPQELLWSLSRVASTHPHHRREAVQEGAARLVQLLDDEGWESTTTGCCGAPPKRNSGVAQPTRSSPQRCSAP